MSYLSVKNQERSGRSTQVAIPENVDVINFSILNDRRISAKKMAGTLAIS
jgi:hypothetical protein